ncbi:MAG: nucleolar RNA-binding Nop10p family protein [Nanoarchaeota archaeon]
MEELCIVCANKTIPVGAPKYSPEDKYALYRRKAKDLYFKEQGLL